MITLLSVEAAAVLADILSKLKVSWASRPVHLYGLGYTI